MKKKKGIYKKDKMTASRIQEHRNKIAIGRINQGKNKNLKNLECKYIKFKNKNLKYPSRICYPILRKF